jgi:uncharacterized Fe-S cluster protein YjdI
METKQYKNDKITVIWEPSKCIHSAICFKGTPEVFNPRIKPWINLEGCETEKIIKQVKECPSGALTFVFNTDSIIKNANDHDSVLKVKVTPGGPLIVQGVFSIEHNQIETTINQKVTALCRCGQSSKKPFCDGSHRNVDFDK